MKRRLFKADQEKLHEWNQAMLKRPFRSNKILQFATKVTPEFDQKIRETAFAEGIYISDLLEKSLDAYLYLKETKQLNVIQERERERERERAKSPK